MRPTLATVEDHMKSGRKYIKKKKKVGGKAKQEIQVPKRGERKTIPALLTCDLVFPTKPMRDA